ncbi:MAG: DUF2185 domain-containing protein [Azoarcus sp.]|nr:DUF2185 domain-containing protein [Azoarcus sp.]
MNIVDHLEKYLGRAESCWSNDEFKQAKIIQFKQRPCDGAITYATLGMSQTILPLSDNKYVRHELLFAAYEHYPSRDIATFLLSFSEFVLSKDQALWRGDVIGPSTPIIDGIAMNSVYSNIPVIFDKNLSTFYESESIPPVVLIWVLPILQQEAEFIKLNGWGKFEDILETRNPDLLDLNRSSVILPSDLYSEPPLNNIQPVDMSEKKFALTADQIKPLATGYGGCVATDMITVHGKPVGYMVRIPTSRPHDSGWCFTAGTESQEYMDNSANHAVYDVNTIANFSPDIIPFLDAPPQSAFIRDSGTGKLVPIPYEPPLE